ncbi:MAG: hypothetical protein AAB948_04415, partial [Patescibacteria group bacterium]
MFISEQQLYKRYQSLSKELRDVLNSPNIGEIVNKICIAHHLSVEKTEVVSATIGKIILGFIHTEDAADEIHFEIGIDKRIVESIIDEINKKIFSSIRSEIEKVYSPISEGEVEERETKPTTDDLRPTTEVVEKSELEKPSIGVEIKKPEPFMVSKVEPPIRIIGFEEEKKEIQLMDSALPY